jgi:RNA polymerase sigma-70 factor (ECF subfamily)
MRLDPQDNPAHERWVRETVLAYEKPLTLYAQRLLHDVESARDAVQETFLRLCHEREERLRGRLAEWLYSVCRSRGIDMQRKERRMRQLTEARTLQTSGSQDGPRERAELGESAGLALQSLDGLPENQREVLRLKFQHGLSYREIAGVTSLTVSNVGFLIHSGLKTIRRRMKGARMEA